MSSVFYLFRHGETDWNIEKRFMGHTDVPLNDMGREQARILGQRVKELPLTVLYSSDLLRAKETAELIALQTPNKLEIKYDARLREINGGLCEGLRVHEIHQQFPLWWKENEQDNYASRFPDGENFFALVERVIQFIEETARKQEHQQIGLVTHGGVITALITYILGIPQDKRNRITLHNCGITTVEWGVNPKVLNINA